MNCKWPKGKKPKNNEEQRLDAVRSLNIVNEATLGNEGNIFDILEKIRPDVICLGYDQTFFTENIKEKLRQRGLEVEVMRLPAYKPEVYKSSLLKKKPSLL